MIAENDAPDYLGVPDVWYLPEADEPVHRPYHQDDACGAFLYLPKDLQIAAFQKPLPDGDVCDALVQMQPERQHFLKNGVLVAAVQVEPGSSCAHAVCALA